MSGARAIPLFLIALMVGLSLSSVTTVTSENSASATEGPDSSAPDMITIPMYGGLVTMPVGFEAGERFLELVEPPTFTKTQKAREDPDLQPGDGDDYDPVELERRETDYSYMDENWTGGLRLEGVSGSPQGYICVCDATFIFANHSGLDETRPVRSIESKYLWFDNITMYGGGVSLWASENAIVSHSQFIDSNGVVSTDSDRGYVHNISVIVQRPPTNLVHHPPETLPGVPHGRDFMCWPHEDPPPCEGGGVFLSGGEEWAVEWSYFHGAGGAGTETNTQNITIRHNTFRDTTLGVSGGSNEISWNLIRGNHLGGPSMLGCAICHDTLSYHNNSIIMPFKIDHGVPGPNAGPGLWVQNCDECDIRHNDFIGYGIPDYSKAYGPGSELRYPALLARHTNQITANDNYWGTLHDPRIPEGWWIRISHPERTTLVLDRWETEPIHDITPIMYTLDHRDVPYWAERITGLPVQNTWNDLPLPDT